MSGDFLADWPHWLKTTVFTLTGIRRANRLLAEAASDSRGDGEFLTRVLARLRITVHVQGTLDAEVTRSTPVIIAGNHPHGLIDALTLGSIAEQMGRRPIMMARHFLTVFEPLEPLLLPLVVQADRSSRNGRKQFQAATAALSEGQAVIMTPAGRLSLPDRIGAEPRDAPWRTGLVRLARATEATIIPITLTMRVPRWVYWMHRVHPIARSVLQVWQLLLRRPQTITARVHTPVPPDALAGLTDHEATVRVQYQVCGPTAGRADATRT